MEDFKGKFHLEMRNVFLLALEKCKYRATYFLQLVEKEGGFEAARILLAKNGIQYGFTELWKCGCLHLSVEALVLREPWSILFTKEELLKAEKRLKDLGYKFDHGEIV